MTAAAAVSRAGPPEPAHHDRHVASGPGERLPEPPGPPGELVDGVTARWRPHQFTEARAQALGVDLRRWPIVAPAPGWQEDASCRGTSVEVADAMSDCLSQRQASELVGRLCASCPVRQECFDFGRATRGWGFHGGIVLREGRVAIWRTAAERSRRAEATEPTEPPENTAYILPYILPTESTYILPTESTYTLPTEPPKRRRGQRSQPRHLSRARRRGRRRAATA